MVEKLNKWALERTSCLDKLIVKIKGEERVRHLAKVLLQDSSHDVRVVDRVGEIRSVPSVEPDFDILEIVFDCREAKNTLGVDHVLRDEAGSRKREKQAENTTKRSHCHALCASNNKTGNAALFANCQIGDRCLEHSRLLLIDWVLQIVQIFPKSLNFRA